MYESYYNDETISKSKRCEIEAAIGNAMSAYEKQGFIFGFKKAVELMT